MVHYGKHIIDPQTGLCEICDRGEIHEIRTGKHGKQFLYSNQDGKFTYRPSDEDETYRDKEPTPRHARKPLYPEPAVAQPRKVNSHDHAQNQLATLYHVDSAGHTTVRSHGLSEDSRQTYVTESHRSPPTRPVHAAPRRVHTPPPVRPVHAAPRRVQTPPPRASDSWRAPPRRNNNSDTRIVERQRREMQNDAHFYQSSAKPEIYHIEGSHNNNHNFTALHSNTPSPRMNHQVEPRRKPRQLEPIQAPATRRAHNKMPPSHIQPTRRVEKTYTTPRQYESTPPLTHRDLGYPAHNKNPSIYHIQSVSSY